MRTVDEIIEYLTFGRNNVIRLKFKHTSSACTCRTVKQCDFIVKMLDNKDSYIDDIMRYISR